MNSTQEIKKLLRLQTLEDICLEICSPLLNFQIDLDLFDNKTSFIVKNKIAIYCKANKKNPPRVVSDEIDGEIISIGVYFNKNQFIYFDINGLKRSSSFSQADQKNIKSCMFSQFLADLIHDYSIRLHIDLIKGFIDKTPPDQSLVYKAQKKILYRLKTAQKVWKINCV